MPHDRLISIGKLTIDIRSPDVPEDLLAPLTQVSHGHTSPLRHRDLQDLRKKTGIDYVLNPKKLATFLTTYPGIGAALNMDYHTANYGGIFYERIGVIRVTLDQCSQ